MRAAATMLISRIVLAGIFFIPGFASAAPSIDIWWPTGHTTVSGIQPFKAMIPDLDVSQYDMFWQVDGGAWNWMDTSYADYPHKEASVDVTNWTWRGSGLYLIHFIARRNGAIIIERSVTISVQNDLPPATGSDPAVPPAVSKPIYFYVSSESAAAQQRDAWQTTYPFGAAMMTTLAETTTARWLGNWNDDVERDVRAVVSTAEKQEQVPVFVAYNIPVRDCHAYSAGGSGSPSAYRDWIRALAAGIGSSPAFVILEPDALSQIDCLSETDQHTRYQLLRDAVAALKSRAGTNVYLDAGHSGWIDPAIMAERLVRANIAAADGFALNVSNFMTTQNETTYGENISRRINNAHFVIDTARNGNGSSGEWCNPTGRAIGVRPTTETSHALIDAFLWIKTPGESDGYCNGGPAAGTWWPEYALALVKNAR